MSKITLSLILNLNILSIDAVLAAEVEDDISGDVKGYTLNYTSHWIHAFTTLLNWIRPDTNAMHYVKFSYVKFSHTYII